MTKIYQGVIFPDPIQALIDINIITSHGNLMKQLEESEGNSVKGSEARFCTINAVAKMFRGEGNTVSAKRSQRAMQQFQENLNIDIQQHLELSEEEIDVIGYYNHIESYFLGLNIHDKNPERQPLLDHVLALCREEESIFKNYSTLDISKIIHDKFYISNVALEKEISSIFPDLSSINESNKKVQSIVETVLKAHQYLHLLAIFEQEYFVVYGKQYSQEELKKRIGTARLLPTIENGEYVGAINKQLRHIAFILGFSTQEKLVNSLCDVNDINDQENIGRQFDRWKSIKFDVHKTSNTHITPQAINELFGKKYESVIPAEVIIFASLLDQIGRELLVQGLSKEFVVKELGKYRKYQEAIIDKLGTPYLK